MTDAEGVQQELQDYLQQKGINTLFINIVESLLLAKPENPIQHIIQYLQNNFPDQCGTVVASGGTTLQTSGVVGSNSGGDGLGESARSKNADRVDSDVSDSEEEENDMMGDMPEAVVKPFPKGRRVSVSAEAMDPKDAKTFEPVKHEKSQEERKRIHDIICQNMLFKGLDEAQSEILLDAMFPKEFEAGSIIIAQGADGDNFYVLDTGVCEVYKDDALVQTCTEAMSFGELALMYNAPRAATVKVKENAKVWALDRQTFKHIIMETTMKKRELHKGFLENISLLDSLSENERLKVADALKAEMFSEGDVIIKQGEPGDLFYIIEDGSAVCYKSLTPTDAPQRIAELSAGAYFGEIALLTTRPRQATVTASGSVKCLTLDRKTFMRVMGPLEDILKRNMEKYNSVMANSI